MAGRFGFPSDNTDYLFCSYSSSNEKKVASIARALYCRGVPLWYDEGLTIRERFADALAERIHSAQAILLFINRKMFAKPGSFVCKEYSVAKMYKKPILVVYTDEISETAILSEYQDFYSKIRNEHSTICRFTRAAENARIILDKLRYLSGNIGAFPCINHISHRQYRFEAQNKYLYRALSGDMVAQYELGGSYIQGIDVEQNDYEGFLWLELSCEQGYPPAMNNLGYCYQFGLGVERNVDKAFELYHIAADKGHVEATFNLGTFYMNGIGVEADRPKAFVYYLSAAKQGYERAQFNLALDCYTKGYGTEIDLVKAAYWMEKAAEQGVPSAEFLIGMMYYYGDGVDINKTKAKYWYERAAKQGHREAALRLNDGIFD